MNPVFAVRWIFILLLILVVFGALAAIIWRSWIVGSLVLLFVLLIVGLYFGRAIAVPSPAATVDIFEENSQPAIEHSEPDPQMLKTADVYPSLDDAAKYLALRIYDDIELKQPASSIKRIRILSTGKDDIRPLLDNFFRDKYPDAVVVSDDSHDGEPYDMTVKAFIADSGKTKHLTITANPMGRNFSANAAVSPAPWVNQLDQYSRDNPRGQWIVGQSPLAEPFMESAKQQAREDAARQMIPFVTAKFPELNQPNLDQWLRSRLERELAGHHFVKDEFVQRLLIPVRGQAVYRAAVLVDASSSQLERLHSSIISEFHHRNDRVHRFGGGVVATGVVICLVYLFLNRATRGYFQ